MDDVVVNNSYDNSIMYAHMVGRSNAELVNLSKKIIEGNAVDRYFHKAYDVSNYDILNDIINRKYQNTNGK